MGLCLADRLQAHQVNGPFCPCRMMRLAAPHNSKSESLEKYLLYAGCVLLSLFTGVNLPQRSFTQSTTGSSAGSMHPCPGLQGLLEAKRLGGVLSLFGPGIIKRKTLPQAAYT